MTSSSFFQKTTNVLPSFAPYYQWAGWGDKQGAASVNNIFLDLNDDGFNDIIMQCRKPRTDKEISDWKFFCKTTDLLDKHRKTSIIKYIPELEKYWINT